jgi:hypothetical protein
MATYEIVPLTAIGSQTFTVLLGSQQCTINVYQLATGLYCDLVANDNIIVSTMLCLNLVGVVRGAYLGFTGQLFFYDTQGTNDPDYLGLGARYKLVYQS